MATLSTETRSVQQSRHEQHPSRTVLSSTPLYDERLLLQILARSPTTTTKAREPAKQTARILPAPSPTQKAILASSNDLPPGPATKPLPPQDTPKETVLRRRSRTRDQGTHHDSRSKLKTLEHPTWSKRALSVR